MAALWANPDFQLVFWSGVKFFIILNTFLGLVTYTIYAERKICGHMQARTGPNRVGPLGLLQTPADVLKLLFKEEFVPAGAHKAIFYIAPIIAVIPPLVTFAVVPLGPLPALIVTDVDVALLVFLAMSSLGVYSITLAGWSSNNKYALLGGLRSAAQMISYELAMGLSVVGVILLAGSLSLVEIVKAQERMWFIVPQLVAFAIFMLTALAETNRAPFDLPEAEAELVAGFHTEYSSMKWSMFFLGEYMNIFAISAIAVTLFLGGWNGPGPPALGFVWFVVKILALLFFFIWVRWTFPRLRYDQLMNLGWKVLLPISIANVLVTAIWVYWRTQG